MLLLQALLSKMLCMYGAGQAQRRTPAHLEDGGSHVDKPRWQDGRKAHGYEVGQQLGLLGSHSPAEGCHTGWKEAYNYILHTRHTLSTPFFRHMDALTLSCSEFSTLSLHACSPRPPAQHQPTLSTKACCFDW